MGQSIQGNDVVEFKNYHLFQNTATTQQITRPGMLKYLSLSGRGNAGTIGFYDNLDGTTANPIAEFDSTNVPNIYHFDVNFSLGLTVITSNTTEIEVGYN